jgi:hypothetical protein
MGASGGWNMTRRTTRAVLALIVATGALALAAPASAGELDQQQTTITSGSNSSSASFAQTFTAGLSGLLDQADLAIQRHTLASPCTSDLTIQIRTVDATGAPTTTVLASATIPDASIGTATFLSANFAAPATVFAGTQYALVLVHPSPSSGCNIRWGVATGDPYPGGAWWALGSSTSVMLSDLDFAFRTYVASPT